MILQANLKNADLPKFTEQFIQEYESEGDRVLEEELNTPQAGRKIRRKNIAVFRILEPEFSRVVEKELGVGQVNWIPEEDFKYTGLIYEYLLVREGLRSPKNFQQ